MAIDKKKQTKPKKEIKSKQVESKSQSSQPKKEVVEKEVLVEDKVLETDTSDTELLDQTVQQFTNISVLVQDIQGQMSKLRNELKLVEKSVSKEMKVLDKVHAKKKKK